MKTIKYLPKEILNKNLISTYDLIILPTNKRHINKEQLIIYKLFNIPNIKLDIGEIKIISNKPDIMLINFISITNMLDIIKQNEYKNILLISNKTLNIGIYPLLKDFVNNNTLDIDITY